MRTTIPAAILLAASAASLGCSRPECTSLYDCGAGDVCTADGTCVKETPLVYGARDPDAPPSQPWIVGGNGGGGSDADPARYPVIPNGVITGTVGPLTFDAAPVELGVSGGITAIANGVHADAALFLFDQTGTNADILALLQVPGTYVFTTDNLDAPMWGQACTFGEASGSDHYDEPADTTVVVSEPTPSGDVTVEITQTTQLTNVTATATIHPDE